MIVDVPESKLNIQCSDEKCRKENLIPDFKYLLQEDKSLEYNNYNLKRCSKCVLPETMPFIKFDEHGICNYCNNYNT